MQNKLTRIDIALLVIALASILYFINIYADIFPTASIHLKLPQSRIEKKAQAFLAELGYSAKHSELRTEFLREQKQIKFLEKRFGLKRANQLLADSVAAFFWKVQWDTAKYVLTDIEPHPSTPDTLTVTNISLQMTTDGRLIDFTYELDDSTRLTHLKKAHANDLAEAFIVKASGEDLSEYELREHRLKADKLQSEHHFKWRSKNLIAGQSQEIRLTLRGNLISEYHLAPIIPGDYQDFVEKESKVEGILIFASVICCIVLIIIVLVQKLKSNAISFKVGFLFAAIAAVAMFLVMLFQNANSDLVQLLFNLTIPALFVSLIILMLAAAGDSVARDVWPEKLLTLDALRKRFVFFPQIGWSILRGIMVGFAILGVISLVYKNIPHFIDMGFSVNSDLIKGITSFSPFLSILSDVIVGLLFIEFTFRLLLLSFLRKYFKKAVSMLVLAALLSSFVSPVSLEFSVWPFSIDIFINFIAALLLGYTFFKFDFLAALIAAVTPSLFFDGYFFASLGDAALGIQGSGLLLLLPVLGIVGLIAVLRKQTVELDLMELAPPYVSQLAENERLMRELEIARHVQLSFLPKRNPSNENIDIATLCIPANEVGGDYFDFVELDAHRLGIVIGDVSGKGISAAFYMTLTKGFLKAQARDTRSPRDVLIRLNELFYENVERGTFVSMIYGIFDFKSRQFTFARAGHNPLIVRKGQNSPADPLRPQGMALGLDKGVIFQRTIEEQTLTIEADDLFVFYTDGFSEAMNRKNEEFGEMRLQSAVEGNLKICADELLQQIHTQVNRFVGKTPQHDDMTLIIARIK